MTTKTSPQHRAQYNLESQFRDISAGIREDFHFADRNGRHRAVEAFNPATGITTSFTQTEAEAA